MSGRLPAGDHYARWLDFDLEHLRNCLSQWWLSAPLRVAHEDLIKVRLILDILTSIRLNGLEFVQMALPQREPRMLPQVTDFENISDKLECVQTLVLLRDAACHAGGVDGPLIAWELAADCLMMTAIRQGSVHVAHVARMD